MRKAPKASIRVVADHSVPGTTHALLSATDDVIARLYTFGLPAWREDCATTDAREALRVHAGINVS